MTPYHGVHTTVWVSTAVAGSASEWRILELRQFRPYRFQKNIIIYELNQGSNAHSLYQFRVKPTENLDSIRKALQAFSNLCFMLFKLILSLGASMQRRIYIKWVYPLVSPNTSAWADLIAGLT